MRFFLVVVALATLQVPVRNWRERPLVVIHGDDVSREHLDSLTRRRAVRWVLASEATRSDLASGNVTLVGTMTSNPFLRELAPEELSEWYDRSGHIVQIVQRNPLSPENRMVLVIGEVQEPLRRRRADVHVWRHGKTLLLGFGAEDGTFETRRFDLAETPGLVIDGFRFFLHGLDVPPDVLPDVLEDELRRLVVRGARADVHVYRSLEHKGLVTDDTRSAHEEDGVFHVVLGVDERPARFIHESLMDDTAPLLVRRGRAAMATLDAETLDRLDDTARRLLRTSDPPSIVELLDDERFEAESPFVTDAVSASWARFSAGSRHDHGLARDDVVALEKAWARHLSSLQPGEKSPPSPPSSFLRGVTYAHMGYQIHNGYLSARSDASLSKLEALGIDAVAIVPYAFMRDARTIGPLEIPTRAGSETDESVVHAMGRARSKGMTVMLKPQIWVRGSWPGAIAPAGPEEEALFFREYRRWILHYALMAEAHQAPILALGTELAKLTRGYRREWKTIIDDIRAVYRGKLVYAANWGEEVRNVDFWDLVDYIGVDFYYPLSFEEIPSDDELAEGFESALDEIRALHQRYQKPVLLTEIGYASTRSPWRKPHASHEVRELSPADQARAYEIALAAVADETGWLRGMYWWKWPTTLDRGGLEHRGFTPNGKPAEDVLRRWYGSRLQ